MTLRICLAVSVTLFALALPGCSKCCKHVHMRHRDHCRQACDATSEAQVKIYKSDASRQPGHRDPLRDDIRPDSPIGATIIVIAQSGGQVTVYNAAEPDENEQVK